MFRDEEYVDPEIINLTSDYMLYESFKVCKKRCNLPILETALLDAGKVYCWMLNKKNDNSDAILLKKPDNVSLDLLIKDFSEGFDVKSQTAPVAAFIKSTRKKQILLGHNTIKTNIVQGKAEIN